MERNDSQDTDPTTAGAGPPSGSAAHDALRRLEERLDRASSAAERLMTEAAQSAAERAAGKVPPAGWEPRAEPGAGGDGRERDLELLATVLDSLRELVPAELQRRLAEALREVLLALRALIDWYLERAGQRDTGPSEVEDIPIQ